MLDVPKQEQPEEEPENVQPVNKPKKVLSEKQLQALALGRQKGMEKLKQSGEITKQKKEVVNRVKQIKQEEKIDTVQELSRYADASNIKKYVEDLSGKFDNIHSKFQNIDSKFDSYLTERQQRLKDKQNRVLEETVKKELPRAMNDIYLKEKISKELSRNPLMNRV